MRIVDRGSRIEPRSGVGLTQFSLLHPSLRSPRSSKGFTLIELIIVITIIVVLMGLFLNRALFYMEQAEKTAMEQVAGSIPVSYTHLRAHETRHDLVCRLLLEKKKKKKKTK